MVAPLGRRTLIAGLTGDMGVSGRSVLLVAMKWPVAPVSALSVVVVGGADISLRLKYELSTELYFFTLVCNWLRLIMLPPVQDERPAPVTGERALQRSVHPPILLVRVASSLWPSFFLLQSLLLCLRFLVIPWDQQ